MITTYPLNPPHRDMVNRVIRRGDVVAWTNGKRAQPMLLCTVIGSRTQRVNIRKPDGSTSFVNPYNCLVVTQQMEQNIEGRVGANMDLEATRYQGSDNA